MVEDEVDAQPRREGGQPRKQVERLEDEVARAVLPWALQLEHDVAVLGEPESILRDRWPQQVPAELLAPLAMSVGNIELAPSGGGGPGRGHRQPDVVAHRRTLEP